MSKIKIVTDSTADIPKHLAEELDIEVVPLTVHFGEEAYRDGYDLTPSAFFEKLKNFPDMPTTSQITPAMFEEAFKDALRDNDTIICITLSSKASGTHQSALIAKGMIENGDIEVIDSMAFSYGYGMIVVEAARMVKEGKSKEEIVAQVKDMLQRLDTYFIVDTLAYLKKGGRINLTAAVVGTILNIKPLLSVQDGLVVPVDKIRGNKNIIPKMVKLIKSKGYDLSERTVGLAHGAMPERLEELKETIGKEFHPRGFAVSEVGSVIGAHAGPGIIGMFILR